MHKNTTKFNGNPKIRPTPQKLSLAMSLYKSEGIKMQIKTIKNFLPNVRLSYW